jgi:hypothetical protein
MGKNVVEWEDVLPEHIAPEAVEALIGTLADTLAMDPGIVDALEACHLQPTSRANWLAAQAAVIVLVMHEIGQEVARDQPSGK